MKAVAFFFIASIITFTGHGQVLEFSAVEKLSSSVNSAYEESMPLLSVDGRSLYFSRTMHPENIGGQYGGSDVWISRWDVTTRDWGKPSNRKLGFNTKTNNTLAGINRKGDVLYLLNTWGLFFTRKSGDTWMKPEKINIPDFVMEGFVGVYVAPDYDVIFLSMTGKDSQGEEDLYVSLKDDRGNWTSPKNLGSTINTKGFEISPFLSADKKRLYFSSNGHPGSGDADVFYSDRLYESWDIWTTPKNLGTKINSEGFDAYFSIYGDSTAFFASNRGSSMADLYSVKVSLAKEYGPAVKRFLTESERREFIGAAPTDIRFDKNSSGLSAAHNELLFFIANKVIPQQDMKVQLVTKGGGSTELTAARLEALSDKLKALGIGGYRIDTYIDTKDQALPTDVIKILFFR